jgi:hypothetical protein
MLRILKVSLIDWCYRRDCNTPEEWQSTVTDISSALQESAADVCVIERNSHDWHQDFAENFTDQEYSISFVDTANLDSRLNIRGGTTVLFKKTSALTMEIADSIQLSSSQPQFDGGQPTSVPVIKVNGINIAIGCMPQNLGRELSVQQMYHYNDFLRLFWSKSVGQNIVAVPIWDKYQNRYDIHVWQTQLRDAVHDDRQLIDFVREGSNIVMVEMFQEYHKEHCVIPQAFMTQIRVYDRRINPLSICSNIPGLAVTVHELTTKIKQVNDTSFLKYFTLEHKSF